MKNISALHVGLLDLVAHVHGPFYAYEKEQRRKKRQAYKDSSVNVL